MNNSSSRVMSEEDINTNKQPISWWKRLGFVGFMFFFLKGMGWIAIFVISYIWGPEALDTIKAFFSNLF